MSENSHCQKLSKKPKQYGNMRYIIIVAKLYMKWIYRTINMYKISLPVLQADVK